MLLSGRIRCSVTLSFILLFIGLLLLVNAVSFADQNPDIRIQVDSQNIPKFLVDPHPQFRNQVHSLTGDPGEALLAWASFESTALTCNGTNSSNTFASIHGNDVSLFLLNPSDSTQSYRVELRLPRGLYGVQSRIIPGLADIQPRRSLALADTDFRVISGNLPPKSLIAIQVSDILKDARSKLTSVSSYLQKANLPSAHVNRVTRCLEETSEVLDRVSARLGKSDRSDLAKDIHRGMLLACQAEALLRNAAAQGNINGKSVDSLQDDLTQFQLALSRISAACFDVFPIISIESPQNENSPAILTLTLVNRGSVPVSLINFEVDPPTGWTAVALTYTLFSKLGTGESLSAKFALGLPSDQTSGSLISIPCDISYFANHSAAHLKQTTTVKIP